MRPGRATSTDRSTGTRGCRRSSLKVPEPSAAEVEEQDSLDCRRLQLDYNNTSPGRLRQLIDELNRF